MNYNSTPFKKICMLQDRRDPQSGSEFFDHKRYTAQELVVQEYSRCLSSFPGSHTLRIQYFSTFSIHNAVPDKSKHNLCGVDAENVL